MRPTILSGKEAVKRVEGRRQRFIEKLASWALHGSATPAKHEQVHAAVQEKHKKTEEDLDPSGQSRRIKKRQDVVLDETGLIPRSSSRLPEPLLQGRERADPAGEFNQGSPTRRGQVEPHHPPPFQDQESAEQDKQNEGEMEKNEEISQPVIEQRGHSQSPCPTERRGGNQLKEGKGRRPAIRNDYVAAARENLLDFNRTALQVDVRVLEFHFIADVPMFGRHLGHRPAR